MVIAQIKELEVIKGREEPRNRRERTGEGIAGEIEVREIGKVCDRYEEGPREASGG